MSSMILNEYGKPFDVRNESSNMSHPAQWLIDALTGGVTNPSGIAINERALMSITAAYACVRNIAEDIAKMPLMVYKSTEDGKEKQKNSPLYRMLHDRPDPNEYSSAFQFRRAVTKDCALGNGYAFIRRNGMQQPVGLRWISRHRVKPVRRDDDSLAYELRSDSGALEDTIPAKNMLHLAGFGDGDMGWSIEKLFARAFGISVAQGNSAASFFGNGMRIGGILQHPGKLSPEAANRLIKDFEERHLGSENAWKLAVLEEDMKFAQTTVTPQESQALESWQMAIEEMCRIWRMPPHKIMHLLRSTFSNIESQNIEYVQDCLTSYVIAWEQEVKIKLVADSDQDTFAEHSLTAMLRGDNAARSAFYKIMLECGVLSINDIRALENQNGIGENGDIHWIPMNNLAPVEIAAKGPQPKAIPAPAEPAPAKEPPKPAPQTSEHLKRIVKNHARMLGNDLARIQRAARDKVQRAAKSEKSLAAWGDRFHEGHKTHVANAIRPFVQSYFDAVRAIGRN